MELWFNYDSTNDSLEGLDFELDTNSYHHHSSFYGVNILVLRPATSYKLNDEKMPGLQTLSLGVGDSYLSNSRSVYFPHGYQMLAKPNHLDWQR